ncbi:hypothetical protein BDW62DRAFT_204016 [Aspergillus aurantiobrunneus]
MAHLQALPPELLHRILSLLANTPANPPATPPAAPCAATRPAAARATCTTPAWCRASFRLLAQPLLFRDLNAEHAYDPLNLLIRFIKCLLLHPELGHHVRTKLIHNAARELQLDDEVDSWLASLDEGRYSRLVPLLALKIPNLRALRVPHAPFMQGTLSWLCRRSPAFLPKLEQLWMTPCCHPLDFGYDIGDYNVLLLRKITSPSFELGVILGRVFPFSWEQGRLAAQELAFIHCFIDAPGIQKLMRACKTVKSFTYQNFSRSPEEVRPFQMIELPEFDAAEAHAAMLAHKETLEHFHLEYFREPSTTLSVDEYREHCDSCVKMPSFQDFPVLKTLSIQHALLPEHARFPPSLQRLDITDCNSSIREMAADIASDCRRGKYPNLTEICVLTSDIAKPIKSPGHIVSNPKTLAQCFRSLQDLFKGTTVDFQILPYQFHSHIDDDVDCDFSRLTR